MGKDERRRALIISEEGKRGLKCGKGQSSGKYIETTGEGRE